MAPDPSTAAPTVGPFSLLRLANLSAPPKRPAQPESASAPRAKRAFTLDSSPAMLPPRAPSASGSSIAPPRGLQLFAEGERAQSTSGLEEGSEPTAAELAAFMADEEEMLEMQALQDTLGCLLARANPEMATDVRVARQRVVAHGEQEAVKITPIPPEAKLSDPEWLTEMFNDMDKSNNHHAGNDRQEAHIPVGPQESLDHGQDSMTPRQWALHVARERMQIACTDVEIKQVFLTLAKALGASKVEDGSIKALHAVLLKLERPEMSDKEAYSSTGASKSNFKRWRKQVQHARFDCLHHEA